MKNLIRQISLAIFSVFVVALLYMHFASYGVIPNECSSIDDEIEKRSCEWHVSDRKEKEGHIAAKRKQGLQLLNAAEREERNLNDSDFQSGK